ncbi:MAG TPA: hypothetical protein VII57_05985 [Dehalococcoidia bacterium]|nr:hypothetical protein [Dehalococcoidia bacterium]
MNEPITIVREREDGHHTVRAATTQEAIALLFELEAALGFKPDSPVLVRRKDNALPVQASGAPGAWRCPAHPQREPKLGQNGAYFYCSARPDGVNYCTQRSDDATRRAA